ncbi:MAG: hypothetical protein SFT68_00765 [Rickettsiaceae bacterium]|nr:hypothetical protein [Rickettsiaceae bacterium]
MSDLYSEAQEDYNDYKKVVLLKRLIILVSLLTIVAIIFMVINLFYQSSRQKKLEDRTYLLYQTLVSQKLNKNLVEESILSLEGSGDNISDIARLRIAKIKFSEGKLDDALYIVTSLSSSSKSIVLRNMSKMFYVSILLDYQEISEENLHKAKVYITSIDKTQPFFGAIQILSALLSIKLGEIKEAEIILQKLIEDNNVANGAKYIAESILHKIKWSN